ncbi:hypothetical protein HY523_01840, partial [Candidatus Berkelbacteria bacterium]|nr:hypothetical protein [Candidatus Berkelbacteria bacterium]
HKGVQSVIDQLGTTEFWRLRLGIGRPGQLSTNNYQLTSDKDDISDFVLGRFTAEEEPLVTEAVDQAVTLLVESLENGAGGNT